MLQKFSHPPLLTPSQQLILPECSPHKICVHPSILSLLLLRVFHPLSPKTGGVVVTFHFSLMCSSCPRKCFRGRKSEKQAVFLPSSQLRGTGDRKAQVSSLLKTWGIWGANIWRGLWSCSCYWFLCICGRPIFFWIEKSAVQNLGV